MKIHADRIPDSGLELSEKCEPSVLELDRADIKINEPINLLARITKEANFIFVKLSINLTMRLDCSKCLEEFAASKSLEIKLNFPIENKSVIDLTDKLREEIILGYPLKPLCRPDCRGLCGICGQNLNRMICKCSEDRRQRTEKNLTSGICLLNEDKGEYQWHTQKDGTLKQDAIKDGHTTD